MSCLYSLIQFNTCIRLLAFLVIVLATYSHSDAQVEFGAMKTVAPGIHVLYLDTTSIKKLVTKATIVEFEDCTVLIEAPVVWEGGGGRKMRELNKECTDLIEKINSQFPSKPLRYFLSSHWHPHSLAALQAFAEHNITVVTTPDNLRVFSERVDSSIVTRLREHICVVEGDSLLIADKSQPIIAYKILKSEYPAVPTDEYLTFMLPRQNLYFCSCLYQRMKNARVRSKELIAERLEDLHRFMLHKGIQPKFMLNFDVFNDDSLAHIVPDTMNYILAHGQSSSEIIQNFCSLTPFYIALNSDSLRDEILRNQVPFSYIITAVYRCIDKHELDLALALAQLYGMLNPSDPNAWDTLGECYYLLGKTNAAKYYESQSKRIDKNFTQAGEVSWKKSLEKYKLQWEKLKK